MHSRAQSDLNAFVQDSLNQTIFEINYIKIENTFFYTGKCKVNNLFKPLTILLFQKKESKATKQKEGKFIP